MSKRMSLAFVPVLALALLWLGARSASSQLVEKKQALIVGYSTIGIVISDKEPVYKGAVYVKAYQISPPNPDAKGGPVVAAELYPSQRAVWQLPQGEYEVHYAIRKGSELTTLIHRNVLLRPEGATSMAVEMNGDAKTTIIGGDWTAQHMTEAIKALQAEVASLKREVADLKRK